jgi:purine-binding chemotaxis protein CheW
MVAGPRSSATSGKQRDRTMDAQAAAAGSLQIVTFPVGNEEFGLDISVITEVIRPLPITALPHMPPFIEGVINLRDRIIPLVDLRKRFGVTGSRSDSRKARMIISRGALPGSGGRLGLVVDGVREVMHVPRGRIDRAPEAATGRGADFIAGVARTSGGLVILLDITKVLSREERAALAEAGNGDP